MFFPHTWLNRVGCGMYCPTTVRMVRALPPASLPCQRDDLYLDEIGLILSLVLNPCELALSQPRQRDDQPRPLYLLVLSLVASLPYQTRRRLNKCFKTSAEYPLVSFQHSLS